MTIVSKVGTELNIIPLLFRRDVEYNFTELYFQILSVIT